MTKQYNIDEEQTEKIHNVYNERKKTKSKKYEEHRHPQRYKEPATTDCL